MTFKERLTFWMLQGKVKKCDPGVGSRWKGKKKIKVKMDFQHSAFMTYNDAGLINATLYFDNGVKFHRVDKIGVNEPVPSANIMDAINTWIKDLQ